MHFVFRSSQTFDMKHWSLYTLDDIFLLNFPRRTKIFLYYVKCQGKMIARYCKQVEDKMQISDKFSFRSLWTIIFSSVLLSRKKSRYFHIKIPTTSHHLDFTIIT